MDNKVSSKEDATQECREIGADCIAKFRRSCRNRRSHDEVMELAAELQRAYMVKELHAQVEEKQILKHAEHVRERENVEQEARQQHREALEKDLRRRSEILLRTEEYRRQLDEQLIRKEEERKVLVEEDREYRKVLEEMDRAQEEIERSRTLKKKCELAERAKRERLIFEKTKEIRRREEHEAEEKKQRKDLEYSREIEERSKEMNKLRQEQIQRRECVLLEVARNILNAEAEKREREERLIDLVAEEIKCEFVIREKEQAMRRKRMQQELASSLAEQMVLTERCKQRFVEEDKAWAEDIMRKIMEDEKIARCTVEAKKRMKVQYREDLENLIAHRRRIREEEIARMEESIREQERLERLEAECARKERKRLLIEHAANIANFVNKASLTVEEQQILAESTKEN